MSVETLIINELGPKKPLNLAAMKNLHCPFQCAIVHALLLIVRLSDVNIFHGLIAITPGSRDSSSMPWSIDFLIEPSLSRHRCCS